MLAACLQALPKIVCESSNTSGTQEDTPSSALPNVDPDSPPIASVVPDGYPLIETLQLSSSEISHNFETIKHLGKRSASHELLSTDHMHKQMKMGYITHRIRFPYDIDVEEKCSAKKDTSLKMLKNKTFSKNTVSLPALAVGDSFAYSNAIDGVGKNNQQEEKIQMLEARISQLTALVQGIEGKVDTNQRKALHTEKMMVERFQHQSSALEGPIRDIMLLQSRAESLENKTADLLEDLDTAYIKIGAHGRVIKKILGPGNEMLEEQYGGIDSKGEDCPHLIVIGSLAWVFVVCII
ncbi:uncharacterized protein MELLADRAFT_114106 [Melampsora larici-populina 98AG31]|uniref:Uncharacterized protein n=1 Tax=Melampsora larici-populina (strain 98AG31 / pathotype 3-4-7) TaxID=747676 RepID=F4SC70_MELLP|nr:uncharacterized protein MELLADRAFT_114106 [Melampsora larici-populina 98AG31]EGF97754.1 hypothetical protein MELLADRAFT_114106 [Melampsora larici-populina 98AG31]